MRGMLSDLAVFARDEGQGAAGRDIVDPGGGGVIGSGVRTVVVPLVRRRWMRRTTAGAVSLVT